MGLQAGGEETLSDLFFVFQLLPSTDAISGDDGTKQLRSLSVSVHTREDMLPGASAS